MQAGSVVRAAIGAAAVCGLAAVAVAPVGAAAASPVSTMVLSSDVLPGLSSLTPQALDPSTTVQVGITFSNPNLAAQNAAYQAIYTPGSPEFHHFLTAQQVAAEFGLPQTTFEAVAGWATRDGMRAVFAGSNREYLLLAGTAAQAEQTFSVTLNQYSALGKVFYANSNGPTVPAGLNVDGVIGLNNFLASHTFDHAPASSAPHGPAPQQSDCVTYCIGLTTPEDLWSIYDQPSDLTNAAANFGQGQQMAVLGEGAVQGPLNDLRAFEHEFGLPQIPITIAAINDSFSDTSGAEEWDIDSQASTGMSPKAYGETWIFANDLTDSSVLSDFEGFESDPQVMEANASFGECEADPTSAAGFNNGTGSGFAGTAGSAGIQFTQESNNALEQADLQGKTLFSSTGDTGSSCPVVYAAVIGAGNGILNQGNPETNYPASSPYVVAVGGTVLYGNASTATAPASNATRAEEYAWNFTGGGSSFYIGEPSFQQGITPIDDNTDCANPGGAVVANNTPCNAGAPTRAVPDVAAQSGDVVSNGYAITSGGQPDQPGGGTSLASPLWMGMWTRVQADTSFKNHGYFTNGFADPALYTVGKNATQDPTAFFDIGGTTDSVITNNGYYTSLPRSLADPSGWDYVSGLGSPDVCNLTKDVDSVTSCDTVTDNVAAPAPQDCGQPGLNACVGTGSTCTPTGDLWTNPPHTASDLLGNSDPQLSLLKGDISLSGSTLQVRLTVTNLSETVPTGAAADEWYMLWQYNGTSYFANAELTATNAADNSGPTYADGTVTVTGTEHSYNNNHTDTGSFTTGANGVVEIDVPLANVGAPPLHSDLQQPSGETDIEVGAPGAGGFLEKVDTGGPTCDYLVGTGPTSPSPGSNVPEVPSPLLLAGLGGIAVLTAGGLRRRRRLGTA